MSDINYVGTLANLVKAALDLVQDEAVMKALTDSNELDDETKEKLKALRASTTKEFLDMK